MRNFISAMCLIVAALFATATNAQQPERQLYPTQVIIVGADGNYHFVSGHSAYVNDPAGYDQVLMWNQDWCATNIDPLPDYWYGSGSIPDTDYRGILGQLYYNAQSAEGRTHMSREQAIYMYQREKERCRRYEQQLAQYKGWVSW